MQNGSLFRLRLSIGILSVAVLVLTLGFNVLLSVSTLDRLAIESLLSGYRGAGEHLALGIERGLRFGKPLTQYAGMAEMLQDLRDGAKGISAIEVVDAEGAVLYATQDVSRPQAPAGLGGIASAPDSDRASRQAFDIKALGMDAKSLEHAFWTGPQSYRIVIALHHNGIAGAVALEIAAKEVEAATTGFVRWAVALLAAACVAVCVTLAAWIGLLTGTPEARARLGRSLSVLLLVLIGGTQLAYSTAMLSLFDSFLQKAVRDKTELAAHFIKRDFEYIVHKGVDVRTLTGGEELLTRIVEKHPELGGASLVTPDGAVLASTGRLDKQWSVVEQSVDAYWPSRFRQREEVLRIRLHIDPAHMSENVRALGLDLATFLIISLLFLMELAKLLGMLSQRMLHSLQREGQGGSPAFPVCSAQALRAGGFLFFLAYDMGISFIPVLARTLHVPMWGLPEQVLTGLPISAEMICAGLALFGSGIFSERFGWRSTFAFGVAAAMIGLFMGGGATSLPGLIAARGACGFGFGLVLMACQIGTLEDENAGSGLAGVFAGIFSGSICGAAGGAMLAERIGFEAVFYVAGAIVPIAMLALLLGGTRGSIPGAVGASPQVEAEQQAPVHAAWNFLRDPRMLVLLGMIGIPAALCLTGFLHYMLPLLLTEAKTAQSDIGRIFMLYGLCFITVGPMLGRWLDRSGNKGVFAMFTGLLSGAALLVAGTSSSLPIVGVAVVVIGIAQCMAAPATMLCVVGLASAQRLGRGKTASIYRTMERVGQVLGPILFGMALVRFSVSQTLFAAGAAVCVLAILFLFFWRVSSPRP
jgi:predicted MFS family arabinose efflux permease